jgi:hypothetical protein
MALTPGEIWPMIAGSAVVVYGAGHFVGCAITKMQNGRHVTKEYCSKQHELTATKFETILTGQDEILKQIHEIKAWINKDGIA